MRLLAIAILITLTGCDNVIARQWGGHTEIKLPNCMRIVTATWKEANIWYLTEPMGANRPRATVLRESSVYGQLQGSVTFREHCDRTEEGEQ